MSNGNGKEKEYQIEVLRTPNSLPEKVGISQISDENLRFFYTRGAQHLLNLKGQITALIADLEAGRIEIERRGWFDNEGNDQEGDDLREAPDMDGEAPTETPN